MSSRMSISTSPQVDGITTQDIVRAIQRGTGSERFQSVSSPAPEENKSHTMGSRWSMMKSVIGIAKPRSSIYTGFTHHNDYQRFGSKLCICAVFNIIVLTLEYWTSGFVYVVFKARL